MKLSSESKKFLLMLFACTILTLFVEYGGESAFEGVVIGALSYIAIFKN